MEFAQIKKIEFQFSNLMHSALVSTSGTSEDMFVHIQLINSFLRKVFDVEHIRFSKHKGEIKLQEAKHPFIYQIVQAVNRKLSEEFTTTNQATLRAL